MNSIKFSRQSKLSSRQERALKRALKNYVPGSPINGILHFAEPKLKKNLLAVKRSNKYKRYLQRITKNRNDSYNEEESVYLTVSEIEDITKQNKYEEDERVREVQEIKRENKYREEKRKRLQRLHRKRIFEENERREQMNYMKIMNSIKNERNQLKRELNSLINEKDETLKSMKSKGSSDNMIEEVSNVYNKNINQKRHEVIYCGDWHPSWGYN